VRCQCKRRKSPSFANFVTFVSCKKAVGSAQFSWLWEYKRKQRKIPKKEREKEKKEGFPDLLVP